jgi:hypothetical protein
LLKSTGVRLRQLSAGDKCHQIIIERLK